MKNQSVLLAKETEDGYISLGTITLMQDRSNDADRIEKKSDGKADKMKEQFIWFTTKDLDGWNDGNDITVVARIYGKELTDGIIDRIKDAIWDYMNETEGEWHDDGCLDAAQEQLEKEGYNVEWIKADAEIFI